MTTAAGGPAGDQAKRLRAAAAELAACRQQIADLTSELEETNRGLIAFHRELEVARQAEAQLAAIVRSSDDAMISMTPGLIITTWNPGAERLFGYSAAEMIGTKTTLIPAELSEEFDQVLRQAGNGPVAYDTRRVRKDGSQVDVAVTLSVMRGPGGAPIGYSAVVRDITGRLEAEVALAAARAEREVLAERDRMASDLHNRVIGRIFSAGMSLQGIAALTARPELTARIMDVVADLDMAVGEIRQAIFAITRRAEPRPASLRDQVLSLAAEATAPLGFEPQITFGRGADDIADDVASQVLAVIREALSNTARHAGATSATVTLSADPDVVLLVSDDGRGIGDTARSSGLRNMRDRAEALGGSFAITSEPGAGTQLEWRVPRSG